MPSGRPRVAWWTVSLLMLSCTASGQETAPVDAAAEPAARVLRADTEVHLRLLEPVASNTHQRGDRFKLELAEAVSVDGDIVIPAGATGEGEVVHAAKPGMAGRAGELILVSRFVHAGDHVVKLRSFSAGSGEQRLNLAAGLSFALVGLFVTGRNIALPAGTDVFAKVAADSPLPPIPAAQSVDTLPSIQDESTTESDENESSQQ